MIKWEIRTDERDVEYASVLFLPVSDLPRGWAQCGGCGMSWNDDKSTAVTPTPSARCPFEYEHECLAEFGMHDDHTECANIFANMNPPYFDEVSPDAGQPRWTHPLGVDPRRSST